MTQIREEVSFTKGRVIVLGKLWTRGEPKRADYLLQYKPGIPLLVLEALLDKYADQGIEAIESPDALKIIPFPQIGTPVEIVMAFGGRKQFQSAMRDLEEQIYRTA